MASDLGIPGHHRVRDVGGIAHHQLNRGEGQRLTHIGLKQFDPVADVAPRPGQRNGVLLHAHDPRPGLARLTPGLRRVPTLAAMLPEWRLVDRRAPADVAAVMAWGHRPSAEVAETFAARHGLPLIRVEDGFLRSVELGSRCPPLSIVIDDLGASAPTEWGVAQLLAIVDARWRDVLPTIATTNCASRVDLADRIGERTVSRLAGGALTLRLSGADRRYERQEGAR